MEVCAGSCTTVILMALAPAWNLGSCRALNATRNVKLALAFGFTLAREWRGSLVPCMIAHGLGNFLVATLGMLALGS